MAPALLTPLIPGESDDGYSCVSCSLNGEMPWLYESACAQQWKPFSCPLMGFQVESVMDVNAK